MTSGKLEPFKNDLKKSLNCNQCEWVADSFPKLKKHLDEHFETKAEAWRKSREWGWEASFLWGQSASALDSSAEYNSKKTHHFQLCFFIFILFFFHLLQSWGPMQRSGYYPLIAIADADMKTTYRAHRQASRQAATMMKDHSQEDILRDLFESNLRWTSRKKVNKGGQTSTWKATKRNGFLSNVGITTPSCCFAYPLHWLNTPPNKGKGEGAEIKKKVAQ